MLNYLRLNNLKLNNLKLNNLRLNNLIENNLMGIDIKKAADAALIYDLSLMNI